MNHYLLKYGIKNGIETHISDVESGLKCNCVCPCCGSKLVAKKGTKGIPQEHFAHYKSEQCEHAYETSLHYTAKAFLINNPYIFLPYREYKFVYTQFKDIFQPNDGIESIGNLKSIKYHLQNIKSEKKLHNIIPDIQATIRGFDILIEIAVTSKVRNEKLEKINKIGIPTIEINLSKIDYDLQGRNLELNLFENIKNKKWVYNPKDDILKENLTYHLSDLKSKLSNLTVSKRKLGTITNPIISDCPNFSSNRIKYISLIECRKCLSFYSEYENNILCGYENYNEIEGIINEKNEELKKQPEQ